MSGHTYFPLRCFALKSCEGMLPHKRDKLVQAFTAGASPVTDRAEHGAGTMDCKSIPWQDRVALGCFTVIQCQETLMLLL